MNRMIFLLIGAALAIFSSTAFALNEGDYIVQDGYTLRVTKAAPGETSSGWVVVPPSDWGIIRQWLDDQQRPTNPDPCDGNTKCNFCRKLNLFFFQRDQCRAATAVEIANPVTEQELKCNMDIASYYSRKHDCGQNFGK